MSVQSLLVPFMSIRSFPIHLVPRKTTTKSPSQATKMASMSALSGLVVLFSQISLIFLLLTLIQSSTVRCQDFEDLNNRNSNNNVILNRQASSTGGNLQFLPQQQHFQQAFQPNRFPVQASAQASASSSPSSSSSTSSSSSSVSHSLNLNHGGNQPPQSQSSSRQSLQRPILSNRFAQLGNNQQPQLSAQASSLSGTVVSSQQQTLSANANQPFSSPSTSGNIEQIMKNALAKTSRLETQSSGAEARSDQPTTEPIQSRTGFQFQAPSLVATPSQSSPSTVATSIVGRDKAAEPPETSSSAQQASEDFDKQTTPSLTTTTNEANAHDTKYKDMRFASLFARRNNSKKAKFTPTEQIKARPTLPAFIKSPPDPKQFNTNSAEGQEGRPISQAGTNLVVARIQQQSNQNRQIANAQKKAQNAVITSNTAAAASNKRANTQKSQLAIVAPKTSTGTAKSNGAQASANITSKPASNNPFSKSQQNSSDPANVIAMARRRLLANNAGHQQQKPTTK